MWIALGNDGIFASPLARVSIGIAIPLHSMLGLLLLAGAAAERRRPSRA
jgi:hypothetical protein